MKDCIGLFGTCGGSKWRDPFMGNYKIRNIPFFNPQVDNWTPECAVVEAEHLAEDAIVLFHVTSETYATGSLAEVGFSILNAIKLDARRDVIVMIDNDVLPELEEKNPVAAKESKRARALVIAHLSKAKLDNVYMTRTLNDMHYLSIKLYNLYKERIALREYTCLT